MKEAFLRDAGWLHREHASPWQWAHPDFPNAWYTVKDAYELAVALSRVKIGGEHESRSTES